MSETISFEALVSKLQERGLLDYRFLAQEATINVYKDALDQLLKNAEQHFDQLIQTDETSFKSVVEEYLNNGIELGLLYGFLHHLDSNDGSETTREIIEYFQPKYVAFCNKVSLNRELYQKFITVRDENEELDDEQQRSLKLLIQDMEMAGVHLEGEKKKRLEEINMRLAKLSKEFSNHVLDSRKKFHYQLESDECIKEMPEQDLATAKKEAEERKLEGWVFTLSPPSLTAVMKYCGDREVREIFYQRSAQIATENTEDNRPVALEILQLRREKAELLGCKDFAEFKLQDRMAGSVDEILSTVNEIKTKAQAKADRDFAELKSFANEDDLKPWDIAFYADKLKKKKFQIDEKRLKQFFPLEEVLTGMLGIAKQLYGVEFKEIEAKSYHEEVRNFEVYRDDELVSYFVLDLFARPTKSPGAWCNTLRSRRKVGDSFRPPIVVNVANFGKGSADAPTLLAHREVVTMFHEFGHALHMMLSQSRYVNTSSSHVEWDFVELPSQLMENWCWQKESLDLFVKHFETGEALDDELLNSLKASRTFLSGYAVLRQMEFLNLDLKLHTHGDFENIEKLDEFCIHNAREYSMLEVPDYYRMYASFSHIFAGGYAAGYYSYIWAEILEADVFKKFEQKGILNQEIGEEFEEKILAMGTLRPGEKLFESFMGRQPKVDALMEKLGF